MPEPERQPTAPPIAPPTVPGTIRERAATWPTAIGIIAIVLASVSLLLNAFNTLMSMAMESFMPGPIVSGSGGEMDWPAVIGDMMPLQVTISGLKALAAMLLIAAGIGVLRRRRWGRTAMVAWGWSAIAVGIVVTILTAAMQVRMMDAMTATGGSMPPGMSRVMAVASALIVSAFMFPAPIFVLVWFWMPSSRRETARWA